jgi:hypothetical protein
LPPRPESLRRSAGECFKAGIDAFFSIVAMSASATLVLRHSSMKVASSGLFAAACASG